jgi:hypothetical protein
MERSVQHDRWPSISFASPTMTPETRIVRRRHRESIQRWLQRHVRGVVSVTVARGRTEERVAL